jgi:hypothetical protein
MTALTHDHLQIGASVCPVPLQHVSMLLEGRFDGSLVESTKGRCFIAPFGFDEGVNRCTSNRIS